MNIKLSTERIKNDLENLSAFTATPGNGCSRLPFTEETRLAADYLKKVMEEAGLEVTEDGVGNVFGRLRGADSALPCIMMGSHYDSVYNGGNYDGIAGIVCAIETARVLAEDGIKLRQDYVAAAFMDEEGCRFGTGYFGSDCMLGHLTPDDLRKHKDKDGISIADAMTDYGFDPEKVKDAAWEKGSIGKYIECHIEQGPVLDAEKLEIGLVNCIVGIQRYNFTILGRADHAGTTPMRMRKDAVSVASKIISKVSDFALAEGEGTVATVGYLRAVPGAVNVVAQSAEFSIDVRSTEQEKIDRIVKSIFDEADKQTKLAGMEYVSEEKLIVKPLNLDKEMLGIMDESCKKYGYSYMSLPSGAGHDALEIGQSLPTVMLFVPSKDGRSHCKEEFTEYESFGKAVTVLEDLVAELGK